jgi:hypothetical protein
MSIDDLAQQAADSVRAVMDEAQKQAAEIVAAAEAEARDIRARAEADARERIEKARVALDELGGRLGISGTAVAAPAPTVPDPVPAEPEPADTQTAAVVEEPPVTSPSPAPTRAVTESKSGDAQAARLVALKLALDGVSQDDARAQLASEYDVSDLDSLLRDVYARAGK